MTVPVAPPNVPVFLNELHYDNQGGDVDEGVEIAGPAGTDLGDWAVMVYEGDTGALDTYKTIALEGVLPDHGQGFGTLWYGLESNGLENGIEALALVDGTEAVQQFWSYEGESTMAVDGPAVDLLPQVLPFAQFKGSQEGSTLQLVGCGTTSGDFAWAPAAPESRGLANPEQVFSNSCP
jgi:hypothetical protein